MKNNKGLTLVELLVALAIFAIVIAIIFSSYLSILKPQNQQVSIAENNMNRIVGLEVLRKDIETAGFGLPWEVDTSYSEAASDATSYTPDPSDLNAKDPSEPPAFSFSNNGNTKANDSDVLAIRSTVAALNNVTSHWGYLYENTSTNSEYFIDLGDNGSVDGNSNFIIIDPVYMKFIKYSTFSNLTTYETKGKVYLVFGLSSGNNGTRMPFNRVDYYLKRPNTNFPEVCDSDTYILYRATINQSNGERNSQPILNCVKDFQVVFLCSNGANACLDNAYDERRGLKQVRVFILLQDGKRDPNFEFKKTIYIKDDNVDTGKSFTPTGDEVHYRWKLIELIVNPLNINIRERNLE